MNRAKKVRMYAGLVVGAFAVLHFSNAAPAKEAQDEAALLVAVVDEDHEEHLAAYEWWSALEPRDEAATLRRALASQDVEVARIGAAGLGFPYAAAEELLRVVELLRERPEWCFSPPGALGAGNVAGSGPPPFGSPDVVPYWRAVLRDPEVAASVDLDTIHRVARPEHVAELLPLLARGDITPFGRLAWLVGLLADCDREDQQRVPIARALLYVRLRLHAEGKGAKAPPMLPVPVVASPAEGGLPEAYKTLVAEWLADGLDAAGQPNAAPPVEIPLPYFWLVRWTLDLQPTAADHALLLRMLATSTPRMAKSTLAGPALLWALRHLATSSAGERQLREWATAWTDVEDDRGAFATAVMAQRGTILPGVGRLPRNLRWLADPARAAADEAAALLTKGDDPFAAVAPLAVGKRSSEARIDGGGPSDEDIAAIGKELWERKAPPLLLLAFHAIAAPATLTPEQARRLVALLLAAPPPADGVAYDDAFASVMAELAHHDAEGIEQVVRRWSQGEDGAAWHPWWARLGRSASLATLAQTWPDWEIDERHLLGRLQDPGTEAFLLQQLERAGEPQSAQELQLGALGALFIHAGFHPATAAMPLTPNPDQALVRAKLQASASALRSGDPVGALLVCATLALEPWRVGHVADPRVVAYLRTLQSEADEGRWWQGTAGLAVAGDPAARQTMRRLIEDGRTWILEQFQAGEFAADNSAIEPLVAQLDSNCCLGWAAHIVLESILPTLPFDSGWGGLGTAATRAWIAQFNWVERPWDRALTPVAR